MYRLSVCPHDTAKYIAGWFFLNSYLQRSLNTPLRYEPQDDFIAERSAVLNGGYSIVFANPYSAALFIDRAGFLPAARPVGVFDETILVATLDQEIPSHRPLRVASAADKLITHSLGLSLLEAQGIPLSDCEFQLVGSHLKASQAVIEGKADLGFVYSITWSQLGEPTRSALRVVAETSNRQSFHCFCVGPELKDRLAEVQAVLCSMQNDDQGKKVLEDIHFPAGFEPLGLHDLDPLIEQTKKLEASPT